MISRTKYPVHAQTIRKLFEAAGIGGAEAIAPLGAGEYNAVFSAAAGGREYAIKVAPHPDVPVMTLEKGMMRAELFWYGQMKAHTAITVPEIFYSDFSRSLLPTDYYIMEKLPGKTLDTMRFSKEESAETKSVTARMGAQIHMIKNDRFGYVQNELYDNWYQAIRAMTGAVLRDCAAVGRRSERGERLAAGIDRHRAVLEQAPCRMVNFDIWAPNIICRRVNGKIDYAWIDPERSFWGDPVMDFICFEMMAPLPQKTASMEAYNAVAEVPVTGNEQEIIRYAVAMGYLALIMEVERYYRYTRRHFGWWRNTAASATFFKGALSALEK